MRQQLLFQDLYRLRISETTLMQRQNFHIFHFSSIKISFIYWQDFFLIKWGQKRYSYRIWLCWFSLWVFLLRLLSFSTFIVVGNLYRTCLLAWHCLLRIAKITVVIQQRSESNQLFSNGTVLCLHTIQYVAPLWVLNKYKNTILLHIRQAWSDLKNGMWTFNLYYSGAELPSVG